MTESEVSALIGPADMIYPAEPVSPTATQPPTKIVWDYTQEWQFPSKFKMRLYFDNGRLYYAMVGRRKFLDPLRAFYRVDEDGRTESNGFDEIFCR